MSQEKIVIPGKLCWVNITGEGKESQSGVMQYVASIDLPVDKAKPFIQSLQELWLENRPSKWVVGKADKKDNPKLVLGKPKAPHSMGYKLIEDEGDESFVRFSFKTSTIFKDGGAVKIKVFNARNNEVHLADKLIGNGSVGAISGLASLYTKGGNAGVTLFLNHVQIRQFIEFKTDTGFEIYSEDEAFINIDSDGADFEFADNEGEGEGEGEHGVPEL